MKGALGVLWHHDVSPRSGTYPLRSMLRDGRKGLTGPLCHIGFDRNGVVHVVGAGKANHAGTGKVTGVVRNGGNTRLIGIEMTSAGTRPWDWTAAQLREMPKLGAALGDIFGFGSSKNWAHYEYSNGGKIDPAGLPGAMPGLRSRIAAVRFNGSSSTPAGSPLVTGSAGKAWTESPRVNGFSKAEIKAIQNVLLGFDLDLGHWGADGKYGDTTGEAVQTLQAELHITPTDGIYGPGTEKAVMTIKSDIDYIKRVTVRNQEKIDEGRAELDWVRRVVEANQKRIDIASARVGPIVRHGKEISLRQELADAKTISIANAGGIGNIEQILSTAQVDTTEAKVSEKAQG